MIQNLSQHVMVTISLVSALACQREPLPSDQSEICKSLCDSTRCLDPDQDAQALSECENHCLGKFEESVRQGEDCQVAFSDAMMCVTELTCDEYVQWYNTEDSEDPCPTARDQVANQCDGIYLEPEILPP